MTKFNCRISAVLLMQALLVAMCVLVLHWQQEELAVGAFHGDEKAGPAIKHRILEGYPNRIQSRLEQRVRTLQALTAPADSGHTPHFILNLSKRWQPGQSIRVAFKSGDAAFHANIANTVTEWTKYANLKFDFGLDPTTGKYRSWNPSDTTYSAEIRVSFDQSGYYSLVGNDCVNPTIAKAGDETLNLERFDLQLPSDWKAVALHEFGHAIGFEHEHQMHLAPCDFRFDDDAGYVPTTDQFGQYIPDPKGRRPGLYTLLGGPPNNWPKAVVDFNLKQLPESHAYEIGPFDKDSIMKYFFDDWMFASGAHSLCYTPSENLVVSDGDKKGAAKVYPMAPEQLKAAATLHSNALQEILKIESLPTPVRNHLKSELGKIQKD